MKDLTFGKNKNSIQRAVEDHPAVLRTISIPPKKRRVCFIKL